MGVVVERLALKPVLKQAAGLVVSGIIVTGVGGADALEGRLKGDRGLADEKMCMRTHQAIGIEKKSIPLAGTAKVIQKTGTVLIIGKDHPALGAAEEDMIQADGGTGAGSSRHSKTLSFLFQQLYRKKRVLSRRRDGF